MAQQVKALVGKLVPEFDPQEPHGGSTEPHQLSSELHTNAITHAPVDIN